MGRVTARAVEVGYRGDWRGVMAYLSTPEVWSTRAYTAFVLAVGGLLGAWFVGAVTTEAPIAVVLNALLAYLLFVRPLLGVAERRAHGRGPDPT